MKNFLLLLKNLQYAIKTVSKRAIEKTAEGISDLIGNKTVDKTNISTNSSRELHSQSNEAKDEIEIPQERCISPEKIQQINDELRLVS